MKPSKLMEPLMPTKAIRPFEALSVDLGQLKGAHYLVLVDRYTGRPLVHKLRKLDMRAVPDALDIWFMEYGKPVRIRSDGGPQIRGPFEAWAKRENIIHIPTSPYNHQVNGAAECAVREMKKLLEKTDQIWHQFWLALREYQNTPCFDGLSPAQWLFRHRQRTEAAAAPKAYARIDDEKLNWLRIYE